MLRRARIHSSVGFAFRFRTSYGPHSQYALVRSVLSGSDR